MNIMTLESKDRHFYFSRNNNSSNNLPRGAPFFTSKPPQEHPPPCSLSFLKETPGTSATQVSLLTPAADLTLPSVVRWWGKGRGVSISADFTWIKLKI